MAAVIFASFEFLFLFLPVFLAFYFLAPARGRNWVILVLSWAFYAWWRVDFLLLLAGVTGWSFALGRLIEHTGGRDSRAGGWWLSIGVGLNLAVLGWFKYANFGVHTFNDAARAAGFMPIAWSDILLPIGLSFYVLQAVSYLVDVWRREVPAARDPVAFAAYKAIFSQLIAGPIVRYSEIARDLRARTHSWDGFGLGARRFMVGFSMKVLVADTLSPLVNAAFALPAPTLADAWAAAAAYTLQLFFDFAGYSAMAIGLALMCGFRFPENFRDPYLAGSIQGFWQRWHMTLSRFLRDYLYVPLGGNRLGAARTYVNLLLTMTIGGFWHGANWTFLLWGLWHGALLAGHRLWSRGGGQMPWLPGHVLTVLAVMVGWVAFRAADLAEAARVWAGMLGLHGAGLSDALRWQVTPDQWAVLGLGALAVYAPLLRPRLVAARRGAALARLGWAALPMAAFALAIVMLHSRAAVPFLYFRF